MAGMFALLGGRWNTPQGLIMAVGYMFIPMLAAMIVGRLMTHEKLKTYLGISFRVNGWWLVAWLLPPLMAIATMGVSLLFPGVVFSPGMEGMFDRFASLLSPQQVEQMKTQIANASLHPFWIALVEGLVAGVTVNAIAGFGEEAGWRGLLQKELSFLGFWRSSFLIGAIWGIWHAPLILQGHNYRQHPVVGVAMMTIFAMLLSPILSYIRAKSQSVIASAILHGSLNGSAGLALLMIRGGNDLTVGITGLAGFLVLLIVNIVFFLYDRFLTREPAMK